LQNYVSHNIEGLMSIYPGPTENNPIFNPINWFGESGNGITESDADARYLRLAGGVLSGSVLFNAQLQTSAINYGGFSFTMPTASGQLALTSQITGSYVDLTTDQSVAGIKTFATNPVISAISNAGFTFTMPSATGTLALTSQLANYVDLTTNQSVAGIKTFATNPVISAISNSGFNLTIPTLPSNDEILALQKTQTTTNKTFLFCGAVQLLTPQAPNVMKTSIPHGLKVGDVIMFPNITSLTGITALVNYTLDTVTTTTSFTLSGVASITGSLIGAYYVLISKADPTDPGVLKLVDSNNSSFPLYFDLSSCTGPPVIKLASIAGAQPIQFSVNGGISPSITNTTTISGNWTHTGQLISTRASATTVALSPIYINPASTGLTGANFYSWIYIANPPFTGTTTGETSVIRIAGTPTGGAINSAIKIDQGDIRLANGKVVSTGLQVGGLAGTLFSQIQQGQSTVTIIVPLITNDEGTLAVSFTSSFTSTPRVILTIQNGTATGYIHLNSAAISITTSGFTIFFHNVGTGGSSTVSTGTLIYSWIAFI
jgi:hypothetical protein